MPCHLENPNKFAIPQCLQRLNSSLWFKYLLIIKMHFVHTSKSKTANKLATIPNKMLIETTSNLTRWHVAGGVTNNVHTRRK